MPDDSTVPGGGERKRERPGLRKRILAELRGYAEAAVFAYLVVTFLFNTVGVVGGSMQPTLEGGSGSLPSAMLTGDRVFIPKYETWLRRLGVMGDYRPGNIVVVREPANSPTAELPERQECIQDAIGLPCRPFFIKRVIAAPGDSLGIVAGTVHLNGVPLDAEYITGSGEVRPERQYFPVITQEDGQVTGLAVGFERTFGGITYPRLPSSVTGATVLPIDHELVKHYYGNVIDALAPIPKDAPEGEPFLHELIVPENRYFVMGDNRSPGGSEDSRLFGLIREMSIAGRATAVIWPPRREGEWNWKLLRSPPTFDAATVPDDATVPEE